MPKESPASVLVREDGTPVDVNAEGNQYHLSIRDEEVVSLLREILKECRDTNIYLALIFGQRINGTDE